VYDNFVSITPYLFLKENTMSPEIVLHPRGVVCQTAYDVSRMIQYLLTAQGSSWNYNEHAVLARLPGIKTEEQKQDGRVQLAVFGREFFKQTYFRVGVVRLPETYDARYGAVLFNGETGKALLDAENTLSTQTHLPRGFSDITLEMRFVQEERDTLILPLFPTLSTLLRTLNDYLEGSKERTGQKVAQSLVLHSQKIIGGLKMKLYPPMPDHSLITLGIEQSTPTARDVAWAVSRIRFDEENSVIALHLHQNITPAHPIHLVISYVSGVRIRGNEYLPIFNLPRAYEVLNLFSRFAPTHRSFPAEP